MSDILASIRKIMAQDPASGGPGVVRPAANGVGGSPRPGVRVPEPDVRRESELREPVLPREQAPREQAPREQAKPAPPAPAPSAPPSASAPAAAPVARAPAPPAADEPVSLDDFLAMAAPSRDVITTPIHPATPAAPNAPAAAAPSPTAGGAPERRFLRSRPTDDNGGDAVREPVFGTAPIAGPAPAAQGYVQGSNERSGPGPSLTSPRQTGPGTPAPKADALAPPNAPTASPMQAPMQAPIQAKEAAPGPGRAAPPPPKMLGDLGSVVPSRNDGHAEGTTLRLGELSAGANDRYSPVGAPVPGPTSSPLSRTEPAHVAPAPSPVRLSEPEIPGADDLRRLIAGVVPPSAFIPSAPAPNADATPTKVVLPTEAKAPDAVTVAKSATPHPPAASAAKPMEPASAAKQTEPASAAKAMEPAPAAKAAEVASPFAKPQEAASAVKPSEVAPTAKAIEPAPAAKAVAPFAKAPEVAPAAKPSEAAPTAKAAPVQPAPAPAASSAVPRPAADPAPKPAPAVATPVSVAASPPAGAPSAARTMDETVVELLRPLLRDWLDKNMPRLIEPALKAEIEALRSAISKDRTD